MDIDDFDFSLDIDMDNGRGHVGYIALAGRPNVGKSTLVNQVLDYHLAAVSSRPQTTRKHWRGIYTDSDAQLVFTDTPGIHEPHDKLGETMLRTIVDQLKDADVVLCIADCSREQGLEDEMVAETVQKAGVPVVLAVNKVDAADPEQVAETEKFFKERLQDKLQHIVHISALNNKGVPELLDYLKKIMPEQPFLYDPDVLTDAYERDIASELIQEAVFENLCKEIPHGLMVKIDSWKEDAKKIKINATVHVDRSNHKKMVIGREGIMLNRIKKGAISKLRENIEKRIELKLFVKVSPGWRDNPRLLNDFGFGQDS